MAESSKRALDAARGGLLVKFKLERSNYSKTIRFSGEITSDELIRLRLTPFAKMLLREVETDDKATAADYLLALEMLYRRWGEQATYESGWD